MALVDLYFGSMSFGMSDKKTANVEFRIDPADAINYVAAVGQPLKDATVIGQLFLSIEPLSKGTLKSKGVILRTIEDTTTFPLPSAEAYSFDYLAVKVSSGIYNYSWNIPARDETQYTLADNGRDVIITGAGADPQITDFISRLQAVALTKYGQLATVNRIIVGG